MPRISGKDVTQEARSDIFEQMRREREEGLKHIDGEIEKNDELEKYIVLAAGYLNDELVALGLPATQMDSRRVHAFLGEEYERRVRNKDTNGLYRSKEDALYVHSGRGRMQLYKTILHEMVHRAAFKARHADVSERTVGDVRGGYFTRHPNEDKHMHFRGLDEAVVDRIVMDIAQKHFDELIQQLHITEEESREPVNFYHDYMDVLAIIVQKVAENKKEDPRETWQRFKRGEFSGEMMHLRDVEDAFGKGSLRVLAALGSGTRRPDSSEDAKLVYDYFAADDPKERDQIARAVLNERERLRYAQRTKVAPEKQSSFFGKVLKNIAGL